MKEKKNQSKKMNPPKKKKIPQYRVIARELFFPEDYQISNHVVWKKSLTINCSEGLGNYFSRQIP